MLLCIPWRGRHFEEPRLYGCLKVTSSKAFGPVTSLDFPLRTPRTPREIMGFSRNVSHTEPSARSMGGGLCATAAFKALEIGH
jgi:hypothetical protein